MYGLVLRAKLRGRRNLPVHPLLPGVPQLDAKSVPHDGRGQVIPRFWGSFWFGVLCSVWDPFNRRDLCFSFT